MKRTVALAAIAAALLGTPTVANAALHVRYEESTNETEATLHVLGAHCLPGGVSAEGNIRVTLRAGRTKKVAEQNPCLAQNVFSTWNGSYWTAGLLFGPARPSELAFAAVPQARLNVQISDRRTVTRTFHYSIAAMARKLESGRLIFKVTYTPDFVVYQGGSTFDDYCINSDRPLMVRAGRLSCVVAATTGVDLRRIVDRP